MSTRMGSLLSVVVADDVPEMRAGLRALLEASGRFDVVADTGSGREAVRLALDLQPDVVMLDMRMPDLDGISSSMQIRMLLPEITLVVHSAHDDERFLTELREIGVDAFVPKGSPGATLVRAISDAVERHREEEREREAENTEEHHVAT